MKPGPPLRPVWEQVSLCPHRQSMRRKPLQCLERHLHPHGGYLAAEGRVCAHSTCRGAASVCLGCPCTCATYIHLWAHSSRLCACQCTDRHADGTQDTTCVCLSLSQGPALTWTHATFAAAAGHRGVQADSPVGSLLHSCVGATCMCGHAAFTGMSVCVCVCVCARVHAAFVCMLYFAGEQ